MNEKQDAEELQIDWLQDIWKQLEGRVREKPHQSVLIAFCAGILAGAYLRKGS